jgi:hypothetical protein
MARRLLTQSARHKGVLLTNKWSERGPPMSFAPIVPERLKTPKRNMMIVKLNLSKRIPDQLDQGKNVAAMSREAMTGTEPLIDELDAANTDLQAKQAAVIEARAEASQAGAALRASAKTQRGAYGNLASHVNTVADGSDAFVLSTGYEVRATPTPRPPLTEPPSNVRTRINGVPGNVLVLWKGLSGARNYEVQYTTDLSGATGWSNVPETPGTTRLNVGGLVSGTKYAFRVRGLSTGQPGPWSGPVPQMAP